MSCGENVRKMRIAVFHNLSSGGAKQTLFETVKRLMDSHEVSVYSFSSADHEFADIRGVVSRSITLDFTPYKLLRSPYGRLNQLFRIMDLIRLNSLGRQVAKLIDEGKYDVVFVQPCRFEGSPTVLSHLVTTPSVYYCHETVRILYEPMPPRPYDGSASAHRRALNLVDPFPRFYREVLMKNDRQNVRNADVVLVNSKFSRNNISNAYGVNPQLSYYGVDTNLFRPLNLQRKPWIFSVGSITPLKSFDFLIRAIARIRESIRPGLKIASNFENRTELEYLTGLASEHEVTLDIVTGVWGGEIVRLYNQAAMTIYAPIREPFGLVPIESMACGTPIVAVNEGGPTESVKHNLVGFLVERDEEAFSQAIKRLILDPALRDEFGRNGRKEVEKHWSWEIAVERVEESLYSTASNQANR
jgi:glycosyltransferase involved in cell wall biosynthesis